ncbi:hypothetical protein BO82DRAFT_46885 [Aspergillus uvarum CBS 121591]|uniref:Uncharacterized protein n=1 Tax=Aspergillus uvarum CBS 121591 TaxID=1448315 RepID=A0A319DW73_9EURO|nr:hypothetical protein BO82DRAFT_46885 [Aspergillus uvarum CBS 121591]PYH83172.1 hypothetical protein BO82DRAFT_46885 [Aspergillus uvarum CBS 121591]
MLPRCSVTHHLRRAIFRGDSQASTLISLPGPKTRISSWRRFVETISRESFICCRRRRHLNLMDCPPRVSALRIKSQLGDWIMRPSKTKPSPRRPGSTHPV